VVGTRSLRKSSGVEHPELIYRIPAAARTDTWRKGQYVPIMFHMWQRCCRLVFDIVDQFFWYHCPLLGARGWPSLPESQASPLGMGSIAQTRSPVGATGRSPAVPAFPPGGSRMTGRPAGSLLLCALCVSCGESFWPPLGMGSIAHFAAEPDRLT